MHNESVHRSHGMRFQNTLRTSSATHCAPQTARTKRTAYAQCVARTAKKRGKKEGGGAPPARRLPARHHGKLPTLSLGQPTRTAHGPHFIYHVLRSTSAPHGAHCGRTMCCAHRQTPRQEGGGPPPARHHGKLPTLPLGQPTDTHCARSAFHLQRTAHRARHSLRTHDLLHAPPDRAARRGGHRDKILKKTVKMMINYGAWDATIHGCRCS